MTNGSEMTKLKQTIATILIFTVSLFSSGSAFFLKTKQAQAAEAHVTGGGVNIEQIADTLYKVLKEDLLEQAWAILKQVMIDMMVDQIINWIQGGGEPQFVTNFGEFFEDVANQASGKLVEELNLTQLCDPINIPLIEIALMPPPPITTFHERAECTVTDILDNFNATIEDFYEDFNKGGWEAFVELSMPQNNPYSQYLMAVGENMARREGAVEAGKTEVISAQGFLGNKVCVRKNPETGKCEEYKIQTPGEVIAHAIDKASTIDMDQMVGSRTWGEIAAAIIDAVINRVMREGLAAMESFSYEKRGERIKPPSFISSEILDALEGPLRILKDNLFGPLKQVLVDLVEFLLEIGRWFDGCKHAFIVGPICYALDAAIEIITFPIRIGAQILCYIVDMILSQLEMFLTMICQNEELIEDPKECKLNDEMCEKYLVEFCRAKYEEVGDIALCISEGKPDCIGKKTCEEMTTEVCTAKYEAQCKLEYEEPEDIENCVSERMPDIELCVADTMSNCISECTENKLSACEEVTEKNPQACQGIDISEPSPSPGGPATVEECGDFLEKCLESVVGIISIQNCASHYIQCLTLYAADACSTGDCKTEVQECVLTGAESAEELLACRDRYNACITECQCTEGCEGDTLCIDECGCVSGCAGNAVCITECACVRNCGEEKETCLAEGGDEADCENQYNTCITGCEETEEELTLLTTASPQPSLASIIEKGDKIISLSNEFSSRLEGITSFSSTIKAKVEEIFAEEIRKNPQIKEHYSRAEDIPEVRELYKKLEEFQILSSRLGGYLNAFNLQNPLSPLAEFQTQLNKLKLLEQSQMLGSDEYGEIMEQLDAVWERNGLSP